MKNYALLIVLILTCIANLPGQKFEFISQNQTHIWKIEVSEGEAKLISWRGQACARYIIDVEKEKGRYTGVLDWIGTPKTFEWNEEMLTLSVPEEPTKVYTKVEPGVELLRRPRRPL